MTTITGITGKIELSNGGAVDFAIDANYGWQQWGERGAALSKTADVMQALTAGLKDEGIFDRPSVCCVNCGETIEPDDGGAIWYHADTGASFCDGDDERARSWGETAEAAEPPEGWEA